MLIAVIRRITTYYVYDRIISIAVNLQ